MGESGKADKARSEKAKADGAKADGGGSFAKAAERAGDHELKRRAQDAERAAPDEGAGPDGIDMTPVIEMEVDGEVRHIDIDEPELPDWVADRQFTAAGYPYDKRMKRSHYESRLAKLQMELVKMQGWMKETGQRVIAVFEGRDAAGKGGTIRVINEYLNPRNARVVALTAPTETERGQWYYQRYVEHFPTSGELVTFDRSWYNRGVVEPVMGYCTMEEHLHFLKHTPGFERQVTADGIHLIKFWLNIGRETQIKRFHDRRHEPLKMWKLSPNDVKSLNRWDDYTQARDRMIEATHTEHAPWLVVKANDKRRARINAIRSLLLRVPYEGRDEKAIGKVDDAIVGIGPKALSDKAR